MAKTPESKQTRVRAAIDKASASWKKLWEKRARRARDKFAQTAADFASEHPDAFIMLCDPQSDVMLMAYRNILVPMRYTDPKTGLPMHIVENALNYSQGKEGERAVDQFLLAVDSGIVNIANGLYSRRRKSVPRKVAESLGLAKAEKETIEPRDNPFSAK